jgi:peroxiredoxin
VEQELVDLGYQVLLVSADSPEALRKAKRPPYALHQVLSDNTMAGARALGIAFQLDDHTLKLYREYNVDLDDASGHSHHQLPVPSAFVVGRDAVVRFSYVNPDYKVRVDPSALVAAVRAALR